MHIAVKKALLDMKETDFSDLVERPAQKVGQIPYARHVTYIEFQKF